MAYSEAELIKMSKDKKFMAERWKQRLAVNTKELSKRYATLSKEERAQKEEMLRHQKALVEKYERQAKNPKS
jgi:predicted trehalose synthase